MLSILNGVMGDRLAEDASPFAIAMDIQSGSAKFCGPLLPVIEAAPKLLLVIHGLCTNDLQQHAQHHGYATEPGELLAARLGYFPLYLRYNSGLHVSQNGKDLSLQLEQLVERWPHAIEDLSVVAHSMGGLVMRSAIHQAQQQGMSWPAHLKNVVFLGTPHHGAPLERAGNWLDQVLEHAPYVKSFAALGQMRSAGITDLRYGNLLAQDWDGHGRFELKSDKREIVPLPGSVSCYAVAATLAEKRSILSDRLLGDGLVPLRSALGQHDDAERTLLFPDSSQKTVYKTGHMELLHCSEVNDQLIAWLTGA
jgi:pimeloyl-ACP methyl ester carboxylesterase